jgi:hypothetical protein
VVSLADAPRFDHPRYRQECVVPKPKDNLKERLTHYRQIKPSVIGRKSGRTISAVSAED